MRNFGPEFFDFEKRESLKSKFLTSTKGGKVKPPTGFTEFGSILLVNI
jgi:hypothetical protein